jgi:hypothetical protein
MDNLFWEVVIDIICNASLLGFGTDGTYLVLL